MAANHVPTFTLGTGIVSAYYANGASPNAVTLQPDGKIIVGGNAYGTTDDFLVLRYNTNGVLDTTFNGTGKVVTEAGTGTLDYGRAIALQSDGKIVLGGWTQVSNPTPPDAAVIRYNADGSLDTSFGGTGKVVTDFVGNGTAYDLLWSIAVQPDGKIVGTGTSNVASASNIGVFRYNTDGSLDTTFNGNGKVSTDVGAVTNDESRSIALQTDGKILVAGSTNTGSGGTLQNFAVVRYTSSGALDTSFNGTGKAVTDLTGNSEDTGVGMVVQSDGKIVVAGNTIAASGTAQHDFAVVRYNADGSLDTTFNGSGKTVLDLASGSNDFVNGVALQADGKILVGGSSIAPNGVQQYFTVVRYNSDGTLDTGFGVDGKVRTMDAGQWAVAISVQTDGKIVVTGGASWTMTVLRLNENGSLDRSFDNGMSANSLGSVVTHIENGAAVVMASGVALYDADLTLTNYAGATLTLARNGGASVQDVFSASGVLSFAGGNVTVSGVTIGTVTQSGGTATLTFNTAATQALLEQAIRSIAYRNTSDAPPASVQIDWTFNDANAGGQGTGGAGTVTQSKTINITRTNDAPTGAVTVSGTATQGETLTASSTLADADGLGTISYQWLRGGSAISGATGSTHVLAQADVGAAISVRASYTDGGGTAETRTSGATTAVANTNDAPTGGVTITGTPTQGQALTAGNTLADLDGLGTVSYQWLRGGVAIAGANSSSYSLTQADVGTAISVRAAFTDGGGAAETATSGATAAVVNVNDTPTGAVTIAGTAAQGQILTASNTIADADGLGTISYQWLRGGTAIGGATSDTYTLAQADVGALITVQAGYTDTLGTAETITSGATAAVANLNDAPTGGVTISGSAVEGQVLTAANTLADLDGLGALGLQWLRDGAFIAGANAASYTLVAADVGHAVNVRVAYTDGGGTAEAVEASAVTIAPVPEPAAAPAPASLVVAPGTPGTEDAAVLTGGRSQYTVTREADGHFSLKRAGDSAAVNLQSIERLQFADKSVNLTAGDAGRSITTAQLDSLIELYVAYINRVPDADGMVYWINQYKAGQSLQQIGESFYSAAVQYASLTGYSADMTNDAFVTLVYRNALGRSDPDAEGLAFWSNMLASGAASRGALVSSILNSAHTFKGDAQFGHVADLLDNKVAVGKFFSITNGLVYNSPEESISNGMAIAAAVTATGTQAAIALIGVADGLVL